ncbi:alpha/beta hydrolase fold [Nonomuraea solani]|uniref:Alpha/beta hydrolase fold n=1 Tax=Nonomuraea solani TaxID=1144553 RepID=A0A1H6EVB7_9ACTN|nr:alpha/beta hydrolase [Nonomuraea solani]SEH01031.1 alpha/beta hydrolase fold [Nonomuraea solani]
MTNSAWTGMVPVDDTALAVTDTGGPGRCVVYLNGQFATQTYWRRVIAELGDEFRHITYDMRARGRSRRSADYSFEANVRDVGAVLAARGVDRPLLVGWSYGAPVALHWAGRNPGRVLGVVSVDGAYPWGWTATVTPERIRVLFRRWGWLFPVLRPLHLCAKMSVEEHARSNIELVEICGALGPVLDAVTYPVRYVVATGANLGGSREEMEEMRATLGPVLARNPNIKVSATVAGNHGNMLRKDFRAVADAVRELAGTARDQEVG